MSSGSAAHELISPAHLWVPESYGSLGSEVIDLAAEAGLDLDLEQRLMVDSILSADPAGRLVALEACIVESRQNGKTWALQAIALGDLFLFSHDDDDLFVWSAHLFKTTVEAFRDLRLMIERTPLLSRRVKKMPEANGDEGIELHNGARLNFLARSKTGGRGLAGRRVFLDEAFAVTSSMMGSLFPIMSAQDDAQIRYGSSAGLHDSELLRGLRERGRAGGDPSLVYLEWGSPAQSCANQRCDHQIGTTGCALDDRANWQLANPAIGRRITWDYVVAERRAMASAPLEFARERLGWWDEPDLYGRVIPGPKWDDCRDYGSTSTGKVAVAVDIAPDRSMASVAWCGSNADGVPHVEVNRNEPGTAWVVDAITAMAGDAAVVVIDSAGGAASLIPALEAAGVEVTKATAQNMTQACGAFYDAAMAGELRHIGQSQLDAALAGARKRELAAAWAWNRKDSTVDLTPLVAVTLALWGWQANQSPPALTTEQLLRSFA